MSFCDLNGVDHVDSTGAAAEPNGIAEDSTDTGRTGGQDEDEGMDYDITSQQQHHVHHAKDGGRIIVRDKNGKVTTCTQAERWLYRGDQLRHLHYYSYCGLILVRNMTKAEREQQSLPDDVRTKGHGRQKNPVFYFHPAHVEAQVKIQQLRSKFLVPMRVGEARPPYPIKRSTENMEAFRRRRNRFSSYMTAVLVPAMHPLGEIGNNNFNKVNMEWKAINSQCKSAQTWAGFCKLVGRWKQAYIDNLNGLLHDPNTCSASKGCNRCLTNYKVSEIGTWLIYNNITRGMCTNPTERKIQLKYRARATVPWKQMDPDEVPSSVRTSGVKPATQFEVNAQTELDRLAVTLDKREQQKYAKQYYYQQQLGAKVQFLDTIPLPGQPQSHRPRHRPNYTKRITVPQASALHQTLLESNATNIASPEVATANTSEHVAPVTAVPAVLSTYAAQTQVFQYALTQLESAEQQLRLAILGGPGK